MSTNLLSIIWSNKFIGKLGKALFNNVQGWGVTLYPHPYQKPLPTWMTLEQLQDTWSYQQIPPACFGATGFSSCSVGT